ncbi:hypothetical protein VIGAN_06206100, partial [Vigna angularis var. angularis]
NNKLRKDGRTRERKVILYLYTHIHRSLNCPHRFAFGTTPKDISLRDVFYVYMCILYFIRCEILFVSKSLHPCS